MQVQNDHITVKNCIKTGDFRYIYLQTLRETNKEQKEEKSANPITISEIWQKILAQLEEQTKINKIV